MPDISFTIYHVRTTTFISGYSGIGSRTITYACSLEPEIRVVTFYAIAPLIRNRVVRKLSSIGEHEDFSESVDFKIPRRDRR